MGESTGAGVIFGTTGGVMEAALRSVYEIYTGETLQNVNFEQVRGLAGVRRATINLNGVQAESRHRPRVRQCPAVARRYTQREQRIPRD